MKPIFLCLTLGLLLTGCLSRPSLNRQYFNFSISPRQTVGTNAPVLEIRKITVTPPFESQSFIYRTGEFSYERDAYAEFLSPPAQALIGPLRNLPGYDVTFSGSVLKPSITAEVIVDELYGDFRNRNQPTAVLAMKFIFLDRSGKVLFQKQYSHQAPLKERTAAGVMSGWNEGLRDILKAVDADLRHVNEKKE
jgi:uncharacterized lipoprotein YmbA